MWLFLLKKFLPLFLLFQSPLFFLFLFFIGFLFLHLENEGVGCGNISISSRSELLWPNMWNNICKSQLTIYELSCNGSSKFCNLHFLPGLSPQKSSNSHHLLSAHYMPGMLIFLIIFFQFGIIIDVQKGWKERTKFLLALHHVSFLQRLTSYITMTYLSKQKDQHWYITIN